MNIGRSIFASVFTITMLKVLLATNVVTVYRGCTFTSYCLFDVLCFSTGLYAPFWVNMLNVFCISVMLSIIFVIGYFIPEVFRGGKK